MELKHCSGCNRKLEHKTFARNRCNPDGLNYMCKECVSKRAKNKRIKYSIYWKEHDPYENTTLKKCSSCLLFLERNMFSISRSERDGLSDMCAKCRSTYAITWMRENYKFSMLLKAKSRAKKRGILFTLTENDIIIPELCPVLGIKLEIASGKAKDNSPSLDRIDNNKGYISGNVCIISRRANTIKNNATLEELKALVTYMESTIK